jgi:glycosyltransferase involved in cell wall biosynthesis
MNKPKVSVCIFSYNFSQYIAQALESVLNQKTNFDFEIVVGDDCSTDNSREIISTFQKKHPDKIVLAYEQSNQGGTRNWIQTINRCQGKYIALLDGDDYFIDENKLQKQFDILENNASSNIVFNSVKEIMENKNNIEYDVIFQKDEYFTSDIFKQGWFIRTSSLFFRNGILPKQPPNWVYRFPYRYDTILIILLSINSKAINCKNVMTVWRRHDAGLSYAITKDLMENYNKEKDLYKYLGKMTDNQYEKEIEHYLKKSRTSLVFNLLKTLNFRNLHAIGFRKSINIYYGYFFSLSFNALKHKLKLNE